MREIQVGDVVLLWKGGPIEYEVREIRHEVDGDGQPYVMATVSNGKRNTAAMVETHRLIFVRSGGL